MLKSPLLLSFGGGPQGDYEQIFVTSDILYETEAVISRNILSDSVLFNLMLFKP